MNQLPEIVLHDLRKFADFLLESRQETERTNVISTPAPITTISGAISAATFLISSTPRLIKEAKHDQHFDDKLEERSLLPIRAKAPRQPWAYKLHQDQWVPDFWMRPSNKSIVRETALQWLMNIIEECLKQLRWFYNKSNAQYEEIQNNESHIETQWSKQAKQAFSKTRQELKQAEQKLLHTRQQIQSAAKRKIRPKTLLPDPYPTGQTWRNLRRLERHWRDPSHSLPKYLEKLFHSQLELADLSFLYQRWCTIKLIERWQELGWQASKPDTLPWAVFLGGLIELTNDTNKHIQLWIEPRLTKLGHDCGLYSDQKTQLTPDIVINIPINKSYESIILDPTLAIDNKSLERKGKYIKLLHRKELKYIAGVSVVKRPLRSWAMAPFTQESCRVLLDFDGKCGAIPMNPIDWKPHGLDAFLKDLIEMIT